MHKTLTNKRTGKQTFLHKKNLFLFIVFYTMRLNFTQTKTNILGSGSEEFNDKDEYRQVSHLWGRYKQW